MIKILVAEDEQLSRMSLINHLRRILGADALIEGVSNGRDAVAYAAKLDPQLIFLDIEMPLLNGLEAATIMQSNGTNAKIIFLTAFDRFDYAVGALRAGGSDYLLKPFDKEKISACIEKHLALKTQQSGAGEAGQSAFQTQFSVWLQNHYAEDVSLEQAAEMMGMSVFYFSRLFRASYNRTFLEYLTACRLDRAAELLRTTEIPVRAIAPRVGYGDSNYFSKVFKRHTGMTPTEYRQQHLKNT